MPRISDMTPLKKLSLFVAFIGTAALLTDCLDVGKRKTSDSSSGKISKTHKTNPSSWPTNVIDKCSANHCREFQTPKGVYRLNNPIKLSATQMHVENILHGFDPNSEITLTESQQYVRQEMHSLELDLLRAGCIKTLDALCNQNTYIFNKRCRKKSNFGSPSLSDCEEKERWVRVSKYGIFSKKVIPLEIPRYRTSCLGDSGEIRHSFSPSNFTDNLDGALEALSDTQCLLWADY